MTRLENSDLIATKRGIFVKVCSLLVRVEKGLFVMASCNVNLDFGNKVLMCAIWLQCFHFAFAIYPYPIIGSTCASSCLYGRKITLQRLYFSTLGQL